MSDAQTITRALGGRWHGAYGTACCPAHEDRHPSLSLRDGRDGRLLAYCHAGCDWTAVADALRGLGHLPGRGEAPAPLDPARRRAREREGRQEARRRAEQALRCWQGTRPLAGTPAEAYLRGRGITGPLPRTLRFHPACWHGPTARRRPALVALVEGAPAAHGAPSFAVHRTYLTRQGRKIAPPEDAKMMLGATLGGAVRLRGEPREDAPLVVAEGIETALSLRQGAAGPIGAYARLWAALSTSNLAGLVLPPRPGRLVIAADGDEAGHRAAHALADRARALGWRARLLAAPEGLDWNDVLMEAVAG